MKTAIIVGGGMFDPLELASIHSRSNLIICADSGADIIWEAGLTPELIIGDLDSVAEETLHYFLGKGVSIERDSSPYHLDTELALEKAIEMGADRIIMLGIWGDRLDHSLASLSFLNPETIPVSRSEKDSCSYDGEIYIVAERSILQRVSSGSVIPCGKGIPLALLPLPRAKGVTTKGLQYDLTQTDLTFAGTWSVSNISVEESVEIQYDRGRLALITWFESRAELLETVRGLTGRSEEYRRNEGYYRTLGEIFDHGGKSPVANSEKERRLELTKHLLDSLCPDHNKIKIIHIAGTSGKGSVALYLHSILSGSFRTGLVMSPHVYDFNERIQVNSCKIPHSEVVRIWKNLKEPVAQFEENHGETVLFQEIILLIALTYFREQNVEWAVVETGLGGRFDQTRVLDALITAITQIDIDHSHILGDTIEKIASEKAGIIRPHIPLYTAEQTKEALDVFSSRCEALLAPIHLTFPREVDFVRESGGMEFHCDSVKYSLSNPGIHQAVNANLAVTIARQELEISQSDIQDGLNRVHLFGKIEVRRLLVIDSAHNTRELSVLRETVQEILPEGIRRVVICGMAEEKDHLPMLRQIGMLADFIIFTRVGYRGMDPYMLRRMAQSLPEFDGLQGIMVSVDPQHAYKLGKFIRNEQGEDSCLIVTGSTFLVDEIFNSDENLRNINSGT